MSEYLDGRRRLATVRGVALHRPWFVRVTPSCLVRISLPLSLSPSIYLSCSLFLSLSHTHTLALSRSLAGSASVRNRAGVLLFQEARSKDTLTAGGDSPLSKASRSTDFDSKESPLLALCGSRGLSLAAAPVAQTVSQISIRTHQPVLPRALSTGGRRR